MTPGDKFALEVEGNIRGLSNDKQLHDMTLAWIRKANEHRYTYNYSWLGRPIIQYPQDILAIQELIWRVRPDLVIETGIAHGGSVVLTASMLALVDYCEALENGRVLDPREASRRVVGIDIEIRPHNRAAIEAHPISHRIDLIEGSSIDPSVIEQVRGKVIGSERVLVLLDSNHTHDHVLAELEAYAPITSKGSYCVVFDTLIEDMPVDMFHDRPWGKADNPKTAVREYLKLLEHQGRTGLDGAPLHFEVDRAMENKLLITVAPEGYLQRVGEDEHHLLGHSR